MAYPRKITIHFNDSALTVKSFQVPAFAGDTDTFTDLTIEETPDSIQIRVADNDHPIAGVPRSNLLYWESDLVVVS